MLFYEELISIDDNNEWWFYLLGKKWKQWKYVGKIKSTNQSD